MSKDSKLNPINSHDKKALDKQRPDDVAEKESNRPKKKNKFVRMLKSIGIREILNFLIEVLLG